MLTEIALLCSTLHLPFIIHIHRTLCLDLIRPPLPHPLRSRHQLTRIAAASIVNLRALSASLHRSHGVSKINRRSGADPSQPLDNRHQSGPASASSSAPTTLRVSPLSPRPLHHNLTRPPGPSTTLPTLLLRLQSRHGTALHGALRAHDAQPDPLQEQTSAVSPAGRCYYDCATKSGGT